MEHGDKLDHFLKANAMAMDLEMESQPMMTGGQTEWRDDRQPVLTVPAELDRGLALGRPAAANNRLAYKAVSSIKTMLRLGYWLLLMRAASSVCQHSMASSSGYRAGHSDLWGLQPISRRMHQT